MYKLLWGLLMCGLWLYAQAAQTDEERAVRILFEAKHAVNRAAHAAAQQLDERELADGRFVLDERRALEEATAYLQDNLRLDEQGNPLPGSRLRQQVTVDAWHVVGRNESFPYTYQNSEFNYEVTLDRPGVILIIHVIHPRAFSVMEPIEWHIKGAAQLVLPS
ncbi:hypothetical protein [Paenibacillus herberti]|uniref:Uncharacterized protein n=1 Tax=Paenibacillus herberti TaxID=1619309 RepID=A0A229NVW1_9BACL|nr:hypothetical protein [Paenibacillus herberti]OXM13779.1 hypothetical protein CGZ75_22465 [Paenibacillus herberti]